jgi:hypothetical protein
MKRIEWCKSSYTKYGIACVEVADLDGEYRAVRDSKDPAGPMLRFIPVQWSAFVAGVRDGEFV